MSKTGPLHKANPKNLKEYEGKTEQEILKEIHIKKNIETNNERNNETNNEKSESQFNWWTIYGFGFALIIIIMAILWHVLKEWICDLGLFGGEKVEKTKTKKPRKTRIITTRKSTRKQKNPQSYAPHKSGIEI